MSTILLRFGTNIFLLKMFHIDNAFTHMVFFDRSDVFAEVFSNKNENIKWAELYPFENTFNKVSKISIPDKVKNNINNIEENIVEYTNNLLIYHEKMAEYAAQYEKFLGWPLHETIFDLGDGWLSESVDEIKNISPHAVELSNFNQFLNGLNIDFLYVQIPSKISKKDNINTDFSNKNADNLLYALSQENVPILDLREYILKQNLDHHNLFYKTDPHWKAKTALWVTGILSEYLNLNNDFEIGYNIYDPDNFTYDIYNDWFLGSYGRKVTLARAAPEDITLIYPIFNTDFIFKIPSRNINKQGSFDIFYDYDRIKNLDYYNSDPYGAFCYERNPIVTITNNLVNIDKKILFLVESFGRYIPPFLSLSIKNVDFVDLRSFDGSIKTYIEKNMPDMVIIMYNPNVIEEINSYNPSNNLFDFE
ncbi:alginate O-acetyltransferase AlgX-related protein [Treponema primitia]|uniref:alginate O-acetyltransferase AlgX-related protein n=1 Tax=Treponema primitia TaxID=88058 RepID=UPI0004748292|nr:hypothetical protein [Treponema primitia]